MAEDGSSAATEASAGRVVAVHGSVVDVRFAGGDLPAIAEAVAIELDAGRALVAEVQLHLDAKTVRAVALESTAGLSRGAAVNATGGSIRVPVGEPVLGRLLNTTGDPVDRGPPFSPDIKRRPIHAPAPALARHGAAVEVFHTGIKVIDLLAPLVKGGKAAMFGGAGVGIAEYVFALLTDAVVESIASENEARLAAMEAARDNVSKKLEQLRQNARQARQSEITSEILELITGAQALTGAMNYQGGSNEAG